MTLKELIEREVGEKEKMDESVSDKLFKFIYNSTKEEVIGRVKKLSDKDLLSLKSKKPRVDSSAQGVQARAIDNEIKRRKL